MTTTRARIFSGAVVLATGMLATGCATTTSPGSDVHANMNTHWFYTVWPFIGVGGAIVMIAVLLWTDAFRGNTAVSRWRDVVWLAWLAVPLYLLHQFEEYSLQTVGLDYSIQDMIAQKLGYGLYKAGVIGNTGLLAYAVVIGFTPLILAALACTFFKPESLRPVLTQQRSA